MNSHHKNWFGEVEKICTTLDAEISLPRTCGRQMHHSNMPASTPSEYYCRTISIPLLDHLLAEFNSRFGPHQKKALQGLALVPSVLINASDDSIARLGQLAEMYQQDFPSPGTFQSESHAVLETEVARRA